MLATAMLWFFQGLVAAVVANLAVHIVSLAGSSMLEKFDTLQFKLLRFDLNWLECLSDSYETLR